MCRATHITWVSALGGLTIRSRPNSKANGLTMLKHLFPLFEYRSEATSGQSVLGWVTASSDIPLQGKMLIAAVGYRCCITSWGIDQNSRGHHTKCTLISQPWSHDLWLGRDNNKQTNIGPCHVSGIFLPLRVKSLPLATIYEVKILLQKWKKSLLQRNPAQMTWAIVWHKAQ
jgi:hypothetical protein